MFGTERKTSFLNAINPDGLLFNVSHSGFLFLCAVARGRAVGVDVKKIADLEGMDCLVSIFFPLEIKDFFEIPGDQRQEAFLKTLGEGLHRPLPSFFFPTTTTGPLRVMENGEDHPTGRGWSFYDVPVGNGYAAALVVEGGSDEFVFKDILRNGGRGTDFGTGSPLGGLFGI